MIKEKNLKLDEDIKLFSDELIILTKNGIKAFKNLEVGMNSHYEGLYSSIPEDKKGQIVESLRMLNSILKQQKSCNYLEIILKG